MVHRRRSKGLRLHRPGDRARCRGRSITVLTHPVQRASRTAWWAGSEPGDPLAALAGCLLRSELGSRLAGWTPVLAVDSPLEGTEPGFSGEPFAEAELLLPRAAALVLSGSPTSSGVTARAQMIASGRPVIGVAARPGWRPDGSGDQDAVPEPILLAARHLRLDALAERAALLRTVSGLPRAYMLVEDEPDHADEPEAASEAEQRRLATPSGDVALSRGLRELARAFEAEIVRWAPGPLRRDDPEVSAVLEQRRFEADSRRRLPEDWTPPTKRPILPLRVTSPLDAAAAVANAKVVVARSGPMLALAWALGVPHVALVAPGTAADRSARAFCRWSGDADCVVEQPSQIVTTIELIRRRGGQPSALADLEAIMDDHLDAAAGEIADAAGEGSGASPSSREAELAAKELDAVNVALRRRLGEERLRFAERASALEAAAGAMDASSGMRRPDSVSSHRLEEAEAEIARLHREIEAIYATKTMRMVAPVRQVYGRARRAVR